MSERDKCAVLVVGAFLYFCGAIVSCGRPSISDLLTKPIHCKARIKMPEGWRGEEVDVTVVISECVEK